MFNKHDITRNECMLYGPLSRNGYDWWWHSFTAQDVDLQGKAPYSITAADCQAGETLLKVSIDISMEEAMAHPEWMCDAGRCPSGVPS